MKSNISVPRGTADILPPDIANWQEIESKARRIFNLFNFKEIRTPVFEEAALFKRSLGQTSEVVNKQLLELHGDQKEAFALRPEGTASIVRSYIENSIDRKENLSKWYYMGPMFRGERPQKGRLRQFHQIGAETIGPETSNPYLDAEMISLAVNLLKSFGLDDFKLKISTLGSQQDKDHFSKTLRGLLKSRLSDLAPVDQERFERNVFRVLDSKEEKTCAVIRQLPIDYSYLSSESAQYYRAVKKALDRLKITYEEDVTLVRGLDYYTHTVFEFAAAGLGSQDAVGAGGRYDHLMEQLGGPKVEAIGFALGIERILLARRDKINTVPLAPKVFMIMLEEKFFEEGFELLHRLREAGITSDMSYKVSSIKSQMRSADKSGAPFVCLIGEEEINKKHVTVKDMRTGEQEAISWDRVIQYIEDKTIKIESQPSAKIYGGADGGRKYIC